ncbi:MULTISPECIES: twin-arginine translocase TatA/TatE family subunit [Streptomyces]|uniref:Sec-independent protein translocase protein TatA n=1 Tax=Streptomyces malaysiensis TaxID=92644 RepID=A0A2J7Z2M4_STRMQ|nr:MULTISPECIES: twin-arginine translocase TatA/TatE family subunit [Streptomyces]PNG94516.1 Sec-independent protein translocase protein TatA [Streptomyces malaysiensis]WHX23511.1 twin-arginine translocase TatA/TatE family subunit [Streptomyces sp. NA07423]
MLGLSELALLLIVVIVLIGAKKLPDLTRSAGKAARIFKSEAKAMKADSPPTDGTSAPRVIKAAPGDVTHKAPGAEGNQG